MKDNNLTSEIIGGAIEVHRALGPGLLESAYNECLAYELEIRGLSVQREVAMPIIYKEVELDHGYRIDLLIEERIVVELKVVENFTDVHTAQILTYMKLGGFDLGLLINFHEKLLKNGVKRFVF
ncbi:GxxExxY protein [Brumimicrobium glaciale]|uniref:GxxExxY protein n=2 Tax=Brumimicrobium glaciale TaxID=200475 RepID=A0A4Q4KR68_9FLAO|nr:GxxExxY protein [Brumimicrobium glaciale]